MRLPRQVLRAAAVVHARLPGTSRLMYHHLTYPHSFLGSRIHSRRFLRDKVPPQAFGQWERGAYSDKSSSTIYALSTASGKSAIAVIRISGAACIDVCPTGYFFCWGFLPFSLQFCVSHVFFSLDVPYYIVDMKNQGQGGSCSFIVLLMHHISCSDKIKGVIMLRHTFDPTE